MWRADVTGVFDGMAGVLNATFGAPVVIHPGGGAAAGVRGVLRDLPQRVTDDRGMEVETVQPTLRLPLADAVGLVEGDVVIAASGQRYVVTLRVTPTSPAADRLVLFHLRED